MDEKPSLEFLSPRHWLMDFKMVSRCNSSLDLRGGYGSTAANSPSRGCPSASRYHHVTITCRQVLPRSSYLTLPQSDTPRLRRIPFSSGCSYTSTTGGRKIISLCGWKIGRRRTYEQYARRTWDPILYLPKYRSRFPTVSFYRSTRVSAAAAPPSLAAAVRELVR